MKTLWKTSSVAVVTTGIILFIAAHRAAGQQTARIQQTAPSQQSIDISDSAPAVSFVAEFVDSRVTPDGVVTMTGSATRYVKADGEWRLITRSQNGPTGTPYQTGVMIGTARGVFDRDETRRSLRALSPPASVDIARHYRSVNFLLNHPEFVRTDEILGLTVYVLRTVPKDPTNPEEWLEQSYSPRLGTPGIRLVSHMRDGSEFRRELVRIEFKDLPDGLNDDLKNLPIKPLENKN